MSVEWNMTLSETRQFLKKSKDNEAVDKMIEENNLHSVYGTMDLETGLLTMRFQKDIYLTKEQKRGLKIILKEGINFGEMNEKDKI